MSGPTRTAAGQRLREAWSSGPVPIPGVFSPLVARLAEKLNFRAIYLSGAALSASLGLPDVGLVTQSEFADEARRICQASTLPLLCDADTGFGEALNVERTVRQYEGAGAAGLHLEDQVLPKRCGHLSGKGLVDAEAMVQKIRAALSARHDPSFVVMARTDARGMTSMEDALRRARLYLEAGADAIFPEALQGPEEFAHFAREIHQGRPPGAVPLLANMTEFGKSPLLEVADLGQLGYRLILYPVSTLRAALGAAHRTLLAIRDRGHQRDQIDQMFTRQELYDLLGYQDYEARDRTFFG